MRSLESELHSVKHELSTTRETLTNEKMTLHRQVEELEQKLKLTEAANNSEKVKCTVYVSVILYDTAWNHV